MKTIYKAGNITEAHIVAGLLESHGIESHVGGQYLQGGVGEVATMDFARVFIADEAYDAALPIIAGYEQNKPTDAPDETIDVSVGELGNELPDSFDSPSMMQIFTKPVLFWVSVFLLIWWFIL